MDNYAEKLRSDLVEQFKNQPVIDALIEAVGEQLDDVFRFFCDLRDLRGVHTSVGRQLDGVGDIVVLSRKEAGELACFNRSVFVLDDEEYRKFLIYKIWKNTCKCTYSDIIKAFRMFWDKPLYYSESHEHPATMIFESSMLAPEDHAETLLNAPFVKAAGVAIKIIAYTVNSQMDCTVPVSAYMGKGHQSTVLPEIELGPEFKAELRAVSAVQNISNTILPELEVS